MNLLHDVPQHRDAPRIVSAVIEIPKGSKNKYEFDEKLGCLRLDRVLSSPVRYPFNYGFLPRSRATDGDPLDILVLGQKAILPLTLLSVKAVAVLSVTSAGITEPKIVGVHADDPQYRDYDDLDHLPPHLMAEIRHFFEIYKVLEGKSATIERQSGREAALEEVRHALKNYGRRKRGSWRR